MGEGKSSLGVILRKFLIFGNLSLDDSDKLDSYKKKVCIVDSIYLSFTTRFITPDIPYTEELKFDIQGVFHVSCTSKNNLRTLSITKNPILVVMSVTRWRRQFRHIIAYVS